MKGRQFAPGFRLSSVDLLVLLGGSLGIAFVARDNFWLAMAIGFVVGHFFLFCNVFRVSRGPELVWATIFTAMGCGTVIARFPGWPATFGGGLLCSVILIVREMRKPDYHGVGWKHINPGLEAWWKSQRPR